jgi:hypothetical protein
MHDTMLLLMRNKASESSLAAAKQELFDFIFFQIRGMHLIFLEGIHNFE